MKHSIHLLTEKIGHFIILTLLLLATVAQNGQLFGKKISEFGALPDTEILSPPTNQQLKNAGFENCSLDEKQPGIWTIKNGRSTVGTVIATLEHNRSTFGYAGPVPMFLFLDDSQKIAHIEPLKNNEDPEFFESAIKGGVISQWIGVSETDAISKKPDSVTGATVSSRAINRSIQRSLKAMHSGEEVKEPKFLLSLKEVVALLVLIAGLITSFNLKFAQKVRPALLAINVIVLGFWCGTFISFSGILNMLANGFNFENNLIRIILIILAVILPIFFGKKSYYCTWICPFGAAQELIGKSMKFRKIPPTVLKVLNETRKIITVALFTAMWIGVSSDIVGFEPFSAFLFQNAAPAILIIAVLALISALFTPRPWCRFFCPTGEILSWIQKTEHTNLPQHQHKR